MPQSFATAAGVLVLVGSMVGMVAGTWTSTARILALWSGSAAD